MNLSTQKRLAASIMKVGRNKVWFDPNRMEEIKEAITKADLRRLVQDYAIQVRPEQGSSRGRIRKNKLQKKKGRQAGPGSKKGAKFSRVARKSRWMDKIRSQRFFIKDLKTKGLIDTGTYRDCYLKCKGGFFRSIRHIKTYLKEHELFRKK